ncbi:unnamed protein product [Protopolystoma xenopodis]|uniref:Uncharacterized protein n=1 Tax=Protopolystoma xenopodis TaxID=117903 RepID=A0A3S5BAL8_9PLAT|nr:unnamed protein product [Protopolystoma xenopodis]
MFTDAFSHLPFKEKSLVPTELLHKYRLIIVWDLFVWYLPCCQPPSWWGGGLAGPAVCALVWYVHAAKCVPVRLICR